MSHRTAVSFHFIACQTGLMAAVIIMTSEIVQCHRAQKPRPYCNLVYVKRANKALHRLSLTWTCHARMQEETAPPLAKYEDSVWQASSFSSEWRVHKDEEIRSLGRGATAKVFW